MIYMATRTSIPPVSGISFNSTGNHMQRLRIQYETDLCMDSSDLNTENSQSILDKCFNSAYFWRTNY